jgi:hypothetical protein
MGNAQFPLEIFVETWGHLEVVVDTVVAPREIILNDLVTDAHINGSKPTPMSFKF